MATNYSPKIITDGLVLSLDAADKNSYIGSGTTWSDLSTSGTDGTLSDAGIGTVSGSLNTMAFDRSDDKFEISGSSPSYAFTTEAWINLSTDGRANGGTIVRQQTTNGGWPTISMTVAATGNLRGDYSSAIYGQSLEGAYTTNDPMSANTWYHVAFTKSGNYTTMLLYINGVSQSYTNYLYGSHVDTLATSTHPFRIGVYLDGLSPGTWQKWFGGMIASTRIYNKALSSKEVSQNFNAQRSRFGV